MGVATENPRNRKSKDLNRVNIKKLRAELLNVLQAQTRAAFSIPRVAAYP
jgi:hypothetical protein